MVKRAGFGQIQSLLLPVQSCSCSLTSLSFIFLLCKIVKIPVIWFDVVSRNFKNDGSQAQWYIPVVPATGWSRRITSSGVWNQPGQHSKTPSQKKKNKKKNGDSIVLNILWLPWTYFNISSLEVKMKVRVDIYLPEGPSEWPCQSLMNLTLHIASAPLLGRPKMSILTWWGWGWGLE
jgi:hypothetical protein